MKVGDYVRTKNGNIRKIEEVINKDYNEPDYGVDKIVINIEEVEDTIYMEPFLYKEDIIKSSPNIIDLIEVGDYVNGKKVDKYQGKLGVFCELPNGKWEFIELTNEHYLISSIVTKEQFKNMEYEVK